MITPQLLKGVTLRSAVMRAERLANYPKIVEAMRYSPMTFEEIAKLLKVSVGSAKRYQTAMAHFGLTRRIGQTRVGVGAVARYGLIANGNGLKEFLEFVKNCQSVEEEIGQPPRRAVGSDEDEPTGVEVQSVVRRPAIQQGAIRHWMDRAFFGDGPARSAAA